MAKREVTNVLWRRGRKQRVDLISSPHCFIYSQWNAHSWSAGARGTAFSDMEGGNHVIWKLVKEIHIWVCATWFCCLYCGYILLSVFGLRNTLFCKCFWFRWELDGNKMVLSLRGLECCHLLLSVLLCEWISRSGSVKNKLGNFFVVNEMCDSEECWGVQARALHIVGLCITWIPESFCRSLNAIWCLHC